MKSTNKIKDYYYYVSVRLGCIMLYRFPYTMYRPKHEHKHYQYLQCWVSILQTYFLCPLVSHRQVFRKWNELKWRHCLSCWVFSLSNPWQRSHLGQLIRHTRGIMKLVICLSFSKRQIKINQYIYQTKKDKLMRMARWWHEIIIIQLLNVLPTDTTKTNITSFVRSSFSNRSGILTRVRVVVVTTYMKYTNQWYVRAGPILLPSIHKHNSTETNV